jgi:hypothetical protein
MNDEQVWFEGIVPRNDREARFVQRLRDIAETGGLGDIAATQSWGLTAMVPLYVEVTIPGWLPEWRRRISLQVGYWTTPNEVDLCLEGAWGGSHMLDDHQPADPDCLTLVGLDREPEACADAAAEWISAQLDRHIELREWYDRRGQEAAAEWRLDGTDRLLLSQGPRLRRKLTSPTYVRRMR